MKVRVLFFGATADVVGSRETQIEVDQGATVSSAATSVYHRHPKLRDHKLLFALNQEYVEPGYLITEGDELAIFTAVSGG